MVILGIDPGTATTGYGLIRLNGNHLFYLDHGVILTSPKTQFDQRLSQIYDNIQHLIRKYQPGLMAVEQIFFAKNAKTAMAVGQARGVVLLAAAHAGVALEEYTPLQVKKTITGFGQADKVQIQRTVKAMLGMPELPKPDDAADALAIALTALHHHPVRELEALAAQKAEQQTVMRVKMRGRRKGSIRRRK